MKIETNMETNWQIIGELANNWQILAQKDSILLPKLARVEFSQNFPIICQSLQVSLELETNSKLKFGLKY